MNVIEHQKGDRFNVKHLQENGMRRNLQNDILLMVRQRILTGAPLLPNWQNMIKRHGRGIVGVIYIENDVYTVSISIRNKIILKKYWRC